MATHQIVLLFVGLLLTALLVQRPAARLGLPFEAVLVLVGFLGSEAFVAYGMDTGVRAENFHDLILYVFLPVLVFEAAFRIDARLLLRNLLPILFFAIPLLLLSAGITATLLYLGIGHPAGFPWIAALLSGALLSATDPAAVVSLFRQLGAPARLTLLVDGESLFNDATAIVLFGLFLALALNPAQPVTLAGATFEFLKVFFGGMLVGLLTGLLFLWLSRRFEQAVVKGLVTLISAYVAYLSADSLLGLSGVMAVLVTGLIMGRVMRTDTDAENYRFVDHLWEFNAYIANALVFLLMGVTVTVGMFEERWLAMLIGIGGVFVARAVGIYGFSPLLSRLTPIEPIPLRYQTLMFWGGIRGAVTLALALSLPVELDYWWTIQSIAFGVVLFTLFVQAPTVKPLLRYHGANKS